MDQSVSANPSGPVPDVVYNPTSAPEQPPNLILAMWTLAPGQFALWPGPAAPAQYSIARWTGRAAGTYAIRATFEGIDTPNSTTDVHVQHDRADIPAGTGFINLNGGGNTFTVTANVSVVAGDAIDFAVGPGNGAQAYDATALDALVCTTAADGG
jgi:hypothetical protein